MTQASVIDDQPNDLTVSMEHPLTTEKPTTSQKGSDELNQE